jgi:hypothetical protein
MRTLIVFILAFFSKTPYANKTFYGYGSLQDHTLSLCMNQWRGFYSAFNNKGKGQNH